MPENGFQKSDERSLVARLWRNKESREVIIQIITITLIFLAITLILRNIAINLKTIGKDFNFSFLFAPADCFEIDRNISQYQGNHQENNRNGDDLDDDFPRLFVAPKTSDKTPFIALLRSFFRHYTPVSK